MKKSILHPTIWFLILLFYLTPASCQLSNNSSLKFGENINKTSQPFTICLLIERNDTEGIIQSQGNGYLELAIDSALKYLRDHGSSIIPPQYSLNVNITSLDAREIDQSVQIVKSVIQETSSLLGFIGNISPYLTEVLNDRVFSLYGTPFLELLPIGYRDIDPEKRRDTHPYILNLLPSSEYQVEAILDLCYSHRWNNIATIVSNETFVGLRAEWEIERISKLKGIKLISKGRVNVGSRDSLLNTLLEMKDKNVKVFIVFHLSSREMREILQLAKQLNLYEEGYVWIFSDLFTPNIIEEISLEQSSVNRLKSNTFDGVLFIELSPNLWSSDLYLVQTFNMKNMYLQYEISPLVICGYDAIMMYAYAISPLLKDGINPALDRDYIVYRMRYEVDFLGASGRVKLDKFGDRVSYFYSIMNVFNASIYEHASWDVSSGLEEYNALHLPPGETLVTEHGIKIGVTVAAAGQWFALPSFSTPYKGRYGHAASVIQKNDILDDSVILFGGVGEDRFLNDIWMFFFKYGVWKQILSLNSGPSPRRDHSMAVYKQFMYVFGGYDHNSYLNDVWRFDLILRVWQSISVDLNSSPEPFSRSKTAQSGKYVYFFGGITPIRFSDDLWRYDLENLRWEHIYGSQYSRRVGKIPPRDHHCMVLYHNHIVVFGGRTPEKIGGSSDLWSFDLETEQWRNYPSNSTSDPRDRYAFACTNGANQSKLFISGGYIDDPYDDFPESHLSEIFFLDLEHLLFKQENHTTHYPRWTLIHGNDGVIPPRDTHAVAMYGDYFMVIGGWGDTIILNDFWQYSISKSKLVNIHWNILTPPSLHSHTSVLIGNNMLIFGGKDENGGIHNTLYSFNIGSQMWRTISVDRSPPPRYLHSAIAHGDLMFVFGGKSTSETFYDDLWVFNWGSSRWTKLEISSSIRPGARAGHTAQIVGNSKIGILMFIYGGYAFSNIFDEMWMLDVHRMDWKLVHQSRNNQFVMNVKSLMMQNDKILIYGGSDTTGFFDPQPRLFDTTTYTWEDYGTKIDYKYESKDSAIVRISHNSYLSFGGNRFSYIRNELIALSKSHVPVILTPRTINQTTNPLFKRYSNTSNHDTRPILEYPKERMASSAVYFGDGMIIFGGSGGTPHKQNSVFNSNRIVYSDVWRYRVENHCKNSTSELCYLCSPGTELIDNVCMACPPGTFNEEYDGKCRKCSAGFFGSMEGAASSSLCKPCLPGTYAESEGMQECKPCNDTEYCPLGAFRPYPSIPNNSDQIVRKQPKLFEPSNYEVRTARYILFGILGFVLLTMLIFFTICYPKFHMYYHYLDISFQEKHNHELGVMERKKTRLGGVFSMFTLIVCFALILLHAIPYFYNREQEIRSLIPNLLLDPKDHGFELNIDLKLRGFRGSECGNRLFVTLHGIKAEEKRNHTCHIRNETRDSSLLVQIKLVRGILETIKDNRVHIEILERNTYATWFEYNISTSTGYSSNNDNEYSEIQHELRPGDDNVFRGVHTSSVVSLQLIPSIFQLGTSSPKTGYYLNFLSQSRGDVATFDTFQYNNGIAIEFHLTRAESVLEIKRFDRLDPLSVLGEVLGSIAGMTAFLTILMQHAEHIESLILGKLGITLYDNISEKQRKRLKSQKLLKDKVEELEFRKKSKKRSGYASVRLHSYSLRNLLQGSGLSITANSDLTEPINDNQQWNEDMSQPNLDANSSLPHTIQGDSVSEVDLESPTDHHNDISSL